MTNQANSSRKLTPLEYYRMPWSLTDNGISWLEVTTKCNLACKGCYRDPKKEGDKTLKEIEAELLVFKAQRNSDCISIAGGDPLMHPQIVQIVEMVVKFGWKAIINTNGLALTPALLKDLKKAGVSAFTFHIDTTQKRKDSLVDTEKEHNILRQKFADMLYAEGLLCSFNQTVSEKSYHEVEDTLRWVEQNADKVHVNVFILYREPSMGEEKLDFFVNGQQIISDKSYDNTDFCGGKILKTQDLADKIREIDPMYEPCAYLNGTVDPTSMKWTFAQRYSLKGETLGYAGRNHMRFVQNMSHFFRKRWMSYSDTGTLKAGRSAMTFFSFFDKGSRKAFGKYLMACLKNPLNLFRRVHMQSLLIIQPIDFIEDGSMNMCDGCPDMTVYKGKLYWSCRLEEIKENGAYLTAFPKEKVKEEAEIANVKKAVKEMNF